MVALCTFFILSFIVVITVGCAPEIHQGHEEQMSPWQEGPLPRGPFAGSKGDIHDYMPELLAGQTVSGYDLLPCLENFNSETWAKLDEVYGHEWWNPFWEALREAAISRGRSEKGFAEQTWRNYYLGRALLVSDGAYSGGLMDLAALQWDYDYDLYSSTLQDFFTPEDEETLRRLLTYSLIYFKVNPFSLWLANTGGLALDVYPVGFPFYNDLEEKNREDFQAESFGSGTIAEGDDLQVQYLNPYEGVYTVIAIRTVKEGYSSGGVAIGDPEESLRENWQDRSLKRLDRISYDDEAWFGSQYDYAYIHSQAEGTKSVVFLLKDGIVWGIELIDGLDGAMY